VLQAVDVVFIALHGAYGEDGELQRLLENTATPYTGSRALASAIAMNKVLTKDHLVNTGIKLAPHVYASRDNIHNIRSFTEAVSEVFNGPFVIKPVNGGSSVGTKIARNLLELESFLEQVFGVFDAVIIEKYIAGREATVGVLNNFRQQSTYVLPAVEIVPQSSFFDYDAKYSGTTDEICPGRFSDLEKKQLVEAAQIVHTHLGLQHYSRSDFIVTPDAIYFLEVNTLPGLTAGSLFPKALAAVAISMPDFLRHVLNESMVHIPSFS
jgi:D-alanine-D-alanine ligase